MSLSRKREREGEWERAREGGMMTLSFRLLLDMHKCQSDYNAGNAIPLPRLPAMCLSFCHMPHCIQPKKGQRAVSCECDNAHSVAHSLLTRPSSTTRRNSTAGRSRRSCHWHWSWHCQWHSSSIVLLYAGALIAARLHFVWGRAKNLDSRSKPSAACHTPLSPPSQPLLVLTCWRSRLGHKWRATF